MTVTRADVRAAADRIAGRVRRTPILQAEFAGAMIWLKLEQLQHTGSFKPRGAFNRVLSSPRPDGVIAASGGNHGLAVAHVAETLGLPAEIYVPEIVSPAKLAKLGATEAEVVVGGADYAAALAASEERAESGSYLMVHAYDDAAVVAGQGTTFLELDDQVVGIDAVVVAVGGGGFAAGAAAWLEPGVDLFAVETEGTSTLASALSHGEPVPVEVSGAAADSLGARVIGSIAFPLLAQRARSVIVSDGQVADAQAFLWSELRIVAEPGGAAAVAAVMSRSVDVSGYRAPAVVICGANTDPGSVAD